MTQDFAISNHGSVWLIEPLTAVARAWVDEHVQAEDWQWWGNALAVEHHYAGPLIDAICEADFTTEPEPKVNRWEPAAAALCAVLIGFVLAMQI